MEPATSRGPTEHRTLITAFTRASSKSSDRGGDADIAPLVLSEFVEDLVDFRLSIPASCLPNWRYSIVSRVA